MMHPGSELRRISPAIGYGVIATEFIPKGTFLWVLDELDQVLREDERRTLPVPLRLAVDKYAYVDRHGQYILCWDHGRYMNHSCEPSSRSLGDAIEVAIRDIHPGDEITCEYGVLNLAKPLHCACNRPGCRTLIHPDDVEKYWPIWDQEVAACIPFIPRVDQPLLTYLRPAPADLAMVDAIYRGIPFELPSHRIQGLPAAGRKEVAAAEWARTGS